ncbi:MAG: hypothetical protein WC717_05650 [Candidatus Micrarchaeia archaeon]|jgi:hypothetical protein
MNGHGFKNHSNHSANDLKKGYAQSASKTLLGDLDKLSSRLGTNDIQVMVENKSVSLKARIGQLRKLLRCNTGNVDAIGSEINRHTAKVSQAVFTNHKH